MNDLRGCKQFLNALSLEPIEIINVRFPAKYNVTLESEKAVVLQKLSKRFKGSFFVVQGIILTVCEY